jgi:nucleoside-diphosphate-sugar epimerase
MNIIVTGGSGFIGTNLTTDLLKTGHKVSIYDKRKSELYPDLCIVGDVRDKEKLTSTMNGIDAVFHLAAEHHDNVHPVSLYYEVNEGGAENIVDAMEKNGTKMLIFSSTAAVYGINSGEPREDSPIKTFNDYGKSKYKAEIIFQNWVKSDVTRSLSIVRPTVIFGEKNRGNVYNLLKQLASGRFIMVGAGKNKKSMGYVLNLTNFLTTLLTAGPGKFVYNYSDKPDLRVNELIRIGQNILTTNPRSRFRIPYGLGLLGGYVYDILAKTTGKRFPISSIRIKKFCANTVLNTDKLKETGFVQPYTLEEGLNRMIQTEFLQGNYKNDFKTGDES